MLSAISFTVTVDPNLPFDENKLFQAISSAVRGAQGAMRGHAVSANSPNRNAVESAPTPLDPNSRIGALTARNRAKLDAGELAKDGWEKAKDLHIVIQSLPLEQKLVVQRAIDNGGQLTRDEAYEVSRRHREKSLNGFTKPVKSVVGRLRADHKLPDETKPLLKPVYGPGSPQAVGFEVPLNVVVKMREYRSNQ